MKFFVVISLVALFAWAACADDSTDATPSETAFSPFAIYDERYALGTFAKVSWYQAQITCASHGYTLASINTEIDQNRLRNFFYTRGHSRLHLLNDPIWTSGTNLADSNNYVWFSNGRTFSYRNFEGGSPSGYGQCVGINGITSRWTTEDCQSQRYFVCERLCEVIYN